MNVQDMLNESFVVLQQENKGAEGDPILFIEKWIPEVVNEVQRLRNHILLLETRVTELENDLEAFQ